MSDQPKAAPRPRRMYEAASFVAVRDALGDVKRCLRCDGVWIHVKEYHPGSAEPHLEYDHCMHRQGCPVDSNSIASVQLELVE